jgi:tripartite-type tricarboxylate transporter receptor subunit TctC
MEIDLEHKRVIIALPLHTPPRRGWRLRVFSYTAEKLQEFCMIRIHAHSVPILMLLFAATALAQQQPYPSRPIRIIAGFPPGSSIDTLARVVGPKLNERLGQSVVIDNRPGANGIIAAELTTKATPDGHTLLMTSVSHTMSAGVYKLPYDPVRAFTPIATVGMGPLILVANPGVAANSVRELIELAKAKPNALAYGTAGTGGINHFGAALFARMAGVQMTHVPYKGGAASLTDVMAGQVQLMWATMPLSLPQIRANRIKALGITSVKRSPLLPNVPTVAEAGVPGYEISTWWAMLAPAGIATPVLARLDTELNAITAQPEVVQRLAAEGAETWRLTRAQFGQYLQTEVDKWIKVAREANIRAD